MADERALRRAWKLAQNDLDRFWIGGVLFAVIVAVLGAVKVAPVDASAGERVVYAVGSLLVGVVIVTVGTFGWAFLRAPYVQRNEARAHARAQLAEIARLNAPRPAPALRLDDRLQLDTAAKCIRLRVFNDNATVTRPIAELVEVVGEENDSLVNRAQLPLELAWTHHPEGPPPLTNQDAIGQSIKVIGIEKSLGFLAALDEEKVYAFGRARQPPIGTDTGLKGKTIYVTVAVRSPEYPEVGSITHRYVVTQDDASPLNFRV